MLDGPSSDNSLEWDGHETTENLVGDPFNTAFYPLSHLDLSLTSEEPLQPDRVYNFSARLPIQSSPLSRSTSRSKHSGRKVSKRKQKRGPIQKWFSGKFSGYGKKKDYEDDENGGPPSHQLPRQR